MTDAVMLKWLLSIVGILFAGNIWWARRLVVSNDEFKTFVREKLEEHGNELVAIGERHRLEDSGALGRRWYDPRVSTPEH